jgi:5'-3' exonuclease
MEHTLPPLKPKLLLVDGTSIVRRVFEAVKGDDTPERADGALNSSWGSFMRALREHEPTHFLAAFDHGGETWRHRLYPQYKVDRKPMSAHLSAALPGFLERLNNAGMRTLRVPDVEADDTLTTLALKAVERGFDVVLLASDKDLFKLLASGIRIYDHFQSEWRDAEWVRERYGVTPDKMTDFLALMGDEVDGIPGVDGVGEKFAARLLNQHGDLEGVIAASGDIKGKLGERVRDSFAAARLSQQLATMRTDVPLGITPREIQLPVALIAHIQTMPPPRLVRTSPMTREVGRAHQAQAAQSQSDPVASRARRLRM